MNTLLLLDSGALALENPNGVSVKPRSFVFGDSTASPNDRSLTNIVGNTVCSGNIHHTEVVSNRVARFVLEVDTRALAEDVQVTEVVLFFEDGLAFARGVLEAPYTIRAGGYHRYNVVLITSQGDLTSIDVSYAEAESIPSVPSVGALPNPNNSLANVILVSYATLSEGTPKPIIAMRYGTAQAYWAFSEHSEAYHDTPSTVTGSNFTAPLACNENEYVIVHFLTSAVVGYTRLYRYVGGTYVYADSAEAPTAFSGATLAIWRSIEVAAGSGLQLPSRQGVPEDYVLTAALEWAAPNNGATTINTLYRQPSKLDIAIRGFIGNGQDDSFSLGSLLIDNANYVLPALSGVTQHRTAFELKGSDVEFSEAIEQNLDIDCRVFNRVASTGTRMIVNQFTFIGDGSTTDFDVVAAPNSHVFCWVGHLLVNNSAHNMDGVTLRLSSPPDAGASIDIRVITYEAVVGYSTVIASRLYRIDTPTYFLPLPEIPDSAEYLFISESGLHVDRRSYEIVDGRVVFSSLLETDIEVEILVLRNVVAEGTENTNLKGIVTDAIRSSSHIHLLRHGAPDLAIPIPTPKLKSSDGSIIINGDFPLINLTMNKDATVQNSLIVNDRTEDDVSSLILTANVKFTTDVDILVWATYQAELGSGFQLLGSENLEYMIGLRTQYSTEGDLGRRIRGSGSSGFSGRSEVAGYANGSMMQGYTLLVSQHPRKSVDVVAKLRINNANITGFRTTCAINLVVLAIPRV